MLGKIKLIDKEEDKSEDLNTSEDAKEEKEYRKKLTAEDLERRTKNINKILDKRKNEKQVNDEKAKNPNVIKIPANLMKKHISDNWTPENIWFQLQSN